MGEQAVRLVVFADDWGRHPSSCQHLIGELFAGEPRVPVLWVNTVGTRSARFSKTDIKRAMQVAGGWMGAGKNRDIERLQLLAPLPHGLSVLRPMMYPGFRNGWQRAMNAKLISRSVNRWLKSHPFEATSPGISEETSGGGGTAEGVGKTIAITTLPITADLVGQLAVDRWVYYCVDDFAAWPGLDGNAMQAMEAKQVKRVDEIIAAGENLAARLRTMEVKVEPKVLTHGVDLLHWQHRRDDANENLLRSRPTVLEGIQPPIFLFWGLIDPRLDVAACRSLAQAAGSSGGKLVLIGPQQNVDPAINRIEHLAILPEVDYDELPQIAMDADVLVMPYADMAVTRAMQPLKFKEYLATGKPVVARDLPGIREWTDAADLVSTPDAFAKAALARFETGLTGDQHEARERLERETWSEKAKLFMELASGQPI